MTNSQWVFPSDFNFTYPSPSFLAVAISPSESTLAPNATNSVSQLVLPPPASSAAPRRVVGSPGPTLTSLSASRISKRRFNDVEGYEERSHAVVAKPVKKKKVRIISQYSICGRRRFSYLPSSRHLTTGHTLASTAPI